MPMNAPQFEALLKEVCDAFVDAKKDGKIDAGDMIRVGLLAAGKVGVLKNLSAAEKKAVVLELLEKGLKSLGPKPLGLDEAISVEVEKQLMTAAGAAIDMALMTLKARSMFSYQLCCAGPADVDVGAFAVPAVPSVAAVAAAAVASAEKVLDLSGSAVVAAVAAVAKVVDVSGVVLVLDLSGAAQSASNPSTDSQKQKTDTPALTAPPVEPSPVALTAAVPQSTEEATPHV
jgi:hypothetical protein